MLRQTGDGGRFEQRADRDLDVQGRADAADQAGGQQRMAAQVEEGVVDADALQAQDLGEQAGQDLLLRRARGAADRRREVRRRQRLAVELAVGGQRQGIEHDDGRGHHVVGQPLGQAAAQRRRIERLVRAGHHIADQLLVSGTVLARDDAGLGHRRVLRKTALDLAQLDAEAADLDLLVGAAEEVEVAVGQPAHQIAGAVQPAAGFAEGIGDEALGGQARTVR